MLGTNDLKTRFDPSVDKIAGNIARLVDTFAGMRFGNGPWADAPAPSVGVIAPVPLGQQADDPNWERYPEWFGARAISCALFQDLKDRLSVPVLDAGGFASASPRDPIHFEPDQHENRGQGIAEWMRSDAW